MLCDIMTQEEKAKAYDEVLILVIMEYALRGESEKYKGRINFES